MESHMLKLIAHPDYICEVLEEVIEYNPESKKIEAYVGIVEQATNDLLHLTKTWKNPDEAEKK